jgi:Txe/YoeB family toxin of Txe-Axe toxin-antitoxin module
MITKKTLLLSVCCMAKIWATNPMIPDEAKRERGAMTAVKNAGYRLPAKILCANLVTLEETNLASCREELDSITWSTDQYAYLARAHHISGDHKTSLYYWQRCIDAGYNFSESDVEFCTQTFREISGDPHSLYQLWDWIAQEYKASFCPSWYSLYAIAALEADQYDVADQMIKRHFLLSEKVYSGEHLIAAQANLFKGNPKQATKYFKDYLATEEPAKVSEDAYYNAAVAHHQGCNFKGASKCMDLLFEYSKKTTHEAVTYEKAGTYATLSKELEKAKGYWDKYFELPESKEGDPFNHVSAAQTYSALQDYIRAVQHLETYFALTPREDAEMIFALSLGEDYLALNNLEKACEWFDIAFAKGSISLKGFANCDVLSFHSAILAYALKGNFERIQSVVRVLRELYSQDAWKDFVLNRQTSAKTRGNTNKKGAPKTKKISDHEKASLSAAVQHNVKGAAFAQCDALTASLNKLEIADPQGEEKRVKLLKKITVLQEKVALATDTPNSPNEQNIFLGNALIDLQQKAGFIKRKVNLLAQRQEKVERARKKAQSIAYLETLSQLPKEIIPSPTSGNLRAQYRRVKEKVAQALDVAPATAPAIQEEPQENHVVFSLLSSAQKQYSAMQKIATMRGKYKAFMSEIEANPVQIEGTTGRTKLLQADTGLFARRFDKGNRFVYKVIKTAPNTYNVTILNLLGHYTNLSEQIKMANKKEKSLQETEK